MTMSEEQKQKIYLEWIEEARKSDPRKRANEFTAKDFARDADIGRESAAKILEEKAKLGLVNKRITTRGIYYSLI